MKPQPDVEFAAFAGIDWSDTKHDDESTYLNALKRRGSPLLASIAMTAKNT